MSQWLPPEPGRPRTTPRAVTACRCDRWHRVGVLYRREAEYALGHEIYLDPWISGRSRFGPRSRSIETPAIGLIPFRQRVSEISPQPGRDVLFLGRVVLAIRCCRGRPRCPPAATGWRTRKHPLSPRTTSTSAGWHPLRQTTPHSRS